MQTVTRVRGVLEVSSAGERVQESFGVAFQPQEMRVAPIGFVERLRRESERRHRQFERFAVFFVKHMADFEDACRRVETCEILQMRGAEREAQIALIFGKRIEHFHGWERRRDPGPREALEYLRAVQRST